MFRSTVGSKGNTGLLLEMRRVLVPGGLLVLMDAAQLSESLELAPALHQFSKDLHDRTSPTT